MNENKKKMYDLSGPKTVEAMKKRHFDAYYCSTAAEAVEKALELIPKTDSVSWGGVMTVDELGLKQRLAQEGMTMLVVTHEMAFARDVSNQVVFMHQGVIREQGDPAEFFANPQSAEAQDFLARFRSAE